MGAVEVRIGEVAVRFGAALEEPVADITEAMELRKERERITAEERQKLEEWSA